MGSSEPITCIIQVTNLLPLVEALFTCNLDSRTVELRDLEFHINKSLIIPYARLVSV